MIDPSTEDADGMVVQDMAMEALERVDCSKTEFTPEEVEKTKAVIKMLGDALLEDLTCTSEMFSFRRGCNEALLNDPYIEVAAYPHPGFDGPTVSMLGFINGILNVLKLPKIAAIWSEDDDGTKIFCGFRVYKECVE